MEKQHFHKKVWSRTSMPRALWPLPPFILHSLSSIFPSIHRHPIHTAMCCCLLIFRHTLGHQTCCNGFTALAPMLIVWLPVDVVNNILLFWTYHRLGIRSAIPVTPAMMLLWEIMTPFGIPVDPLVYMTTAISEGRGGRRSHAAATWTETTGISRARELRRRNLQRGLEPAKNTHLCHTGHICV